MPADDLIGAVSRKREVARGEEENKGGQKKKATFPPSGRKLSPSVGKFPAQHRSRTSRPLSPIPADLWKEREDAETESCSPLRWMEQRRRLDG